MTPPTRSPNRPPRWLASLIGGILVAGALVIFVALVIAAVRVIL